jgi:hypothetical protein
VVTNDNDCASHVGFGLKLVSESSRSVAGSGPETCDAKTQSTIELPRESIRRTYVPALAGIWTCAQSSEYESVSYICGVSRRCSTLRDSIFTTHHHLREIRIGQACGASLAGGSLTHSEESGLGSGSLRSCPFRRVARPIGPMRFIRRESECLVTVWNRRKAPQSSTLACSATLARISDFNFIPRHLLVCCLALINNKSPLPRSPSP